MIYCKQCGGTEWFWHCQVGRGLATCTRCMVLTSIVDDLDTNPGKMREFRNKVMEARQKFVRAFDVYPQHLFASPDWADDVAHYFALENGQAKEPIAGKQFCNMMIHVVPTLDGEFLVA